MGRSVRIVSDVVVALEAVAVRQRVKPAPRGLLDPRRSALSVPISRCNNNNISSSSPVPDCLDNSNSVHRQQQHRRTRIPLLPPLYPLPLMLERMHLYVQCRHPSTRGTSQSQPCYVQQ